MEQPAWFLAPLVLAMASANVIAGPLDDDTVRRDDGTVQVDDDIVRTTHGDVRGLLTSVQGREVEVYWGIPYAKTPARFQRPEPAEGWEGVLQATSPPPSCPQVPWTKDLSFFAPPSTSPHENCLFLNLWVPRGCSRADQAKQGGLAVMVWIHGGALQLGSSTVPTYNGQVLASTQCVLVASMNYRLGALGFLSLGTALAPGNVGLLDQVLALQWIRQNVARFGGSPHRITLFGESAGGVSVGAHMASPVSRHLFSRAILQSGMPTAPLAMTTCDRNADTARQLARVMGCPVVEIAGCHVIDEDAMMACMSTVDPIKMNRVLSDRFNDFPSPAFGIVLDRYFLRKTLAESYVFSHDFRKLDVMVGVTANDGSYILPFILQWNLKGTSKPHFEQFDFKAILKNAVFPEMHNSKQHDDERVRLLEYLYVESSLPDRRDSYHTALEKLLTDVNFVCPMYYTVRPQLGHARAYMYSFDHRSSASRFPRWMGAVHASEMDFVFGRPLDDRGHRFSEEERQLSMTIMKAWANFAKTGNPNSADAPGQWPPLNGANYPYAIFRSPGDVTIEHGLRHKECFFWYYVYPRLFNFDRNDPPTKHDEL